MLKKYSKLSLCLILLSGKISANAVTSKSDSTEKLIIAAKAANSKDKVTDINIIDQRGRTQLHRATVSDIYLEEVIELLAAGADVNAQDIFGYTPLHLASRNGALSIVKVLLQNNAHINAASERGDTPLHWAIFFEHTAIVEILIKAGADLDAKDEDDATPLHWAFARKQMEIVAMLKAAGAK